MGYLPPICHKNRAALLSIARSYHPSNPPPPLVGPLTHCPVYYLLHFVHRKFQQSYFEPGNKIVYRLFTSFGWLFDNLYKYVCVLVKCTYAEECLVYQYVQNRLSNSRRHCHRDNGLGLLLPLNPLGPTTLLAIRRTRVGPERITYKCVNN